MEIDSRTRLIAATRDLLWERGYSPMSPRDIQARSRVGQGSMYHHFDGKASLAAAALDATGTEMVATGSAVLDVDGPVLDRIAAYLRRPRPVLRGCPIGRMTEDEEAMSDPALRAPVDRTLAWLRHRLAELLAEGRDGGELTADLDPARTATAVLAGVQGAYVLAKAADDPSIFDDAIEGVLGLLERFRVADPPQSS